MVEVLESKHNLSHVERRYFFGEHALELEVVAEGVETAEQAAETQALGCGFAQGYYFARPAPAGDIESLILSAASLYDKTSG